MVEQSPKILASEEKATITYHKKQTSDIKVSKPRRRRKKKTVVNTPNIKTSLTAS